MEVDDKTYSTLSHHFDIFQDEVKKWVKIFGLFGWETYFTHKEIENQAEVYFIISARSATFVLGTKWIGLEPTECRVRKAAFHEVCELLLGKFSVWATTEDRRVMAIEVAEEVHNIIRILEKVVWEKKNEY